MPFSIVVLVRAALKCAFRMLASISVLTHTPVGEDSTKGIYWCFVSGQAMASIMVKLPVYF